MRTLLGLISIPGEAQGILQYLMDMAEDLRVKLHLLYVENPVYYPLGSPDLTGAAVARLQESLEQKVGEGKKTLEEMINRLSPRMGGALDVKVFAEVGNESAILNELLSSGKVQMIALESKDLNGRRLKNAYITDLIRAINCPVWVIPEYAEYHGIHHIIYATDYQEEDIPTLRRLIDLTHLMSPKISALHITGSVDFDLRIKNAGFQKMLETKTEYSNISVKALVEKGGEDLVGLINSYAALNNADLIVVLKENKNFLDRIFNPSSSEKIILAADKPVLVYQTSGDAKGFK